MRFPDKGITMIREWYYNDITMVLQWYYSILMNIEESESRNFGEIPLVKKSGAEIVRRNDWSNFEQKRWKI